jgi:hypothetical protein
MRANKRGVLLLLVAATVAAFTVVMTLYGQSPTSDKAKAPDNQRQSNELEDQLPVVDFDAPEPSDPEARERRRKKNARHDKNSLVHKGDGYGNAVETTLFNEWDWGLPAIPAARSGVVLTGEVTDAQAHLSNDKTGIYSEFAVKIGEVLKNVSSASLLPGNTMYVERRGGVVRYPNGRKYPYKIADQGMPRVGAQYLFFLKAADGDQVFEIITAYESREGKVFPLDSVQQFDVYKGRGQDEFFEKVRNAIAGM